MEYKPYSPCESHKMTIFVQVKGLSVRLECRLQPAFIELKNLHIHSTVIYSIKIKKNHLSIRSYLNITK
jgi:hypothetical protein